MTRMTRPDCAVMCINTQTHTPLINTHTHIHTYIHAYTSDIQKHTYTHTYALSSWDPVFGIELGGVFLAGVRPDSPLRGDTNWLSIRLSMLLVEKRWQLGCGWTVSLGAPLPNANVVSLESACMYGHHIE